MSWIDDSKVMGNVLRLMHKIFVEKKPDSDPRISTSTKTETILLSENENLNFYLQCYKLQTIWSLP